MKKVLALCLALLMVLSLTACGGNTTKETKAPADPVSSSEQTKGSADAPTSAPGESQASGTVPALDKLVLTVNKTNSGAKVSFNLLPVAAEQFSDVDITDEYAACAAALLAFALYETNPEEALAALTVLTGPNGVSAQDKSFIKEQFKQYPYVARSYFAGSTPANDYTVNELSVEISENANSRTQDGYVTLWLTSGGAESMRDIGFRQKASTKEWFLTSWMGVLAGIKTPESQDEWDGKAGSNPAKFDDKLFTRTGSGDTYKVAAKAMLTAEELETVDITDEFKAAAAVVFALALYEKDQAAGLKALEYLNGPADIGDYAKSFLKDRYAQYPYAPRSYFEGAVPGNDYAPASYTVTVSENPNSRPQDNFITLYITSGGADSPRSITLRKQLSTGKWFVTSYEGLLMGVKTPKSADPWS